MATAMEIIEDKINDRTKVNGNRPSSGFKEHVRGNSEDHMLDLSTYTLDDFSKQKEVMLKSMNAQAEKVRKLGEHILRAEKPDLKDNKHIIEAERFRSDLKAISVANIRLFVELNAYKNFLNEEKKKVETRLPDANNTPRIEIEKNIDELLKEIKNVAKESNGVMKTIGEKKEMELHKVPISVSDIKNLKEDIKGIKDENGDSVAARLGSNLVRFDGAVPPASVQELIINDQKEIDERLSHQSKEFLGTLSRVGGRMFSIDIIRQLSIIDVQLNENMGQKRAYGYKTESDDEEEREKLNGKFYSKKAAKDNPHNREGETAAYGQSSERYESADTVRLTGLDTVKVMTIGTESDDSDENRVSSSQKTKVVLATSTGIMPMLTEEKIIPLSESLRESMTKNINSEINNENVNQNFEEEIALEPFSFF